MLRSASRGLPARAAVAPSPTPAAAGGRAGQRAVWAFCWWLIGCPQLAKDDFQGASADLNSGGARDAAGRGGRGALNAGAIDAGAGSGSGGNGGSRAEAGAAGAPAAAGSGGSDVAACSDGWINGDELGIDCGGPCPSCSCRGEFGAPALVTAGMFGTGNPYSPALSLDAKTLYFSHTVGGDENIYRSERWDRGLTFTTAVAVNEINTIDDDGSPYLTPDGLTLYFHSKRAGGPGDRDLWTATRASTDVDFDPPEVLADISSSAREHFPNSSPDQLSLFFTSDRAGGAGSWDIWLARRPAVNAAFVLPTNMAELNTVASENGMTLSADGLTIIFTSDRAGGLGATDLWVATRTSRDATFSTPVNLAQVNSYAADDDPALSNDGTELYLSSARTGSRRLWRALRSCE